MVCYYATYNIAGNHNLDLFYFIACAMRLNLSYYIVLKKYRIRTILTHANQPTYWSIIT